MALKQATVHTLMLLLMIPLVTAQSLQLVYIGRSGRQPGDNQIILECRRNTIAVSSPQIWVERSDLPRQPVTIVGNRNGQVTVEVTQHLEGSYSCSNNGERSTNTLELVAYPQASILIPSSYAFQEGQQATINCRVMPGKLSQYYSVRWMIDSVTIAVSDPRSVLPGYQLHDNFSLTTNNIQPSDYNTSYQCSVSIDDPQIPGTYDVVYDQSWLGLITVNVLPIIFTLDVQIRDVTMGDTANFICCANDTDTTLHWEIEERGNNYRDCNDQAFCVRSMSEVNSVCITLEIDTTQLNRTQSIVRCVLEQTLGGKTSTGQLTVRNVPLTDMPPRFNTEPQDVVVFAKDVAGNISSLTLNCSASGNPSPNITWFRNKMPLSNEMVNANGTLLIMNITEGVHATRKGLSYHCTANNTFGMIRSRAANVSYAYFDGFDGPNGTVMVNVTTDDGDDDVALECCVQEANPPPQIRWHDGNGVLTEDRTNNRLRFLDNGRYLLIRQLAPAQVNTNYHCEVINARLHETIPSPTMYDLVPNLGDNEYMIYKELINKTILVGDTVEFSYIAGAGHKIMPFGLDDCERSGSTLTGDISLVDDVGGVIVETIPDMVNREMIPQVADSVTFEVRCNLFSGTNPNPSQATLTVHAPPVITRMPSFDLEQLIGQSVTFTCVVSGIPTPTVTWYHNGAELSAGGVISISRNSPNVSVLFLSSLAVNQTGMYQCFASNVVGRTQASWALQVRISALPFISELPTPMNHTEGDHFVLVCSFIGTPPPVVGWQKDGSMFLLGEGRSIINTTGRSQLEINNLTLSDAGVYACSVSNVAGIDTRSVKLEVRVDSVIGKPLLVAPSVGEQVILFAEVTAAPCPTIQWMVNGSVVSSGADYTLNNTCSSGPAGTTSFNFTLTITANSATTGTYTATLTNQNGTVNVVPVFVTPPVPVVINELWISSGFHCLLNETSVDIQCVNFGFPRPEIIFFQDTELITPSQGNFTRFTQVSYDTVRLTMIQQGDGGDYVCEARMGTNDLNRSQPERLAFCTLPAVVNLPAPMSHTEGTHFELVCTFTGIPAPDISWEKDGSVFLLGEGRRVTNSTGRSQLEINSLTLSDAGVYSCSVTNIAGNVTRSVSLKVIAISQPGGNLMTVLPAVLVPACAVLIVGTVAAVVCVMRRQRVPIKSRDGVDMISANREETGAVSPDDQQSVDVVDMLPNNMIIPSGMLKFLGNIGQGEFGLVFKAHLKWHRTAETEIVAIKTLKGLGTPNDIHNLQEEVLKMQYFKHPNVMSLIGVCENFCGGPAVVMPFMANGSVLDYLRRERKSLVLDAEEEKSTISRVESALLGMCLQIAKGMEYIADQKFVHRDLAARNCMIDANGVIKVADFGLAEDVYSANYYRWKKGDTNVKLPIRWMSPESTRDGLFTEKSDVWSFGVTSWEVFTGGTIPYGGIGPLVLVQLLCDGERLSKPSNSACTDEIYSLLLHCWDEQPEKRPSFSELVVTIATMMEAVGGYLSLNVTDRIKLAADTHLLYYNLDTAV